MSNQNTQANQNLTRFKEDLEKLGFTLSDFDDIVVTALEGGSNYWYLIDNDSLIVPDGFERQSQDEAAHRVMDVIYQGGSVDIYEMDIRESLDQRDTKLGTLTNVSFINALQKMFLDSHHFEHFSQLRLQTYDVEAADVMFQFAVMGEIVYG